MLNLFFYIGEKVFGSVIRWSSTNTRIRYNFGLKQRKPPTPQAPGDLASATLPLEDSKVKSLKKEREKNASVFISTGIENSPLRNLCIGADKMTGYAGFVKTQTKNI